MLGILLNEGVEVMYSIVKITYEASRGVYYWYYDEEKPENKKIKNLENRIEELEKQLKNEKVD
jgi:predicted RNase H-like nuclease (RuvC/YqgF family)